MTDTGYRLSATARADIVDVLAQTQSVFGEAARLRYECLLVVALRDLAADPAKVGSLARPELGQDIRSYHLRHSREAARSEYGVVTRPRHLLLYRSRPDGSIGIGRLLHDAMDIARHVPDEFGDE